DLVQAALLEAAVEMDVRRVGDSASALHASEAPARPGNRRLRPVGHVAHRQHGAGLLEVGRRIWDVAAVREEKVLDAARGPQARPPGGASRGPPGAAGAPSGRGRGIRGPPPRQPQETTTKPRFIRNPPPTSMGGLGSDPAANTGRVARLKFGTATVLPRLTTS